ncbi:MAG: sigma-70 family RNA polymerase sigma factor [Planctomycetota bacterium]
MTRVASGAGTGDDGLAAELSQLSGRLELLVAHLAGGALRRRVGVEDLTQDVLVRLLDAESARGLRGEELWRYARSVARSVVVDAARRLRHAPRRSSSIAGAGVGEGSTAAPSVASARAASGPGPGTLAGGREQHARLVSAFDGLAPEHRRVIGLRRFEGLSAAETAVRMGRSEAAVHSLFRRALAAWADASGAS